MTTEQTAQQLELAAQILRTGHPYEFCERMDCWIKYDGDVMAHVRHGDLIRPVLAAPPDDRPLHNPDNLTAEQVGVGYRLVVKDESCYQPHELWCPAKQEWIQGTPMDCTFKGLGYSYRLPLSVPWPKPQPDPYAELKKAHAEGKVIQGFFRADESWVNLTSPSWKDPVEYYRIKPEPTFQLPPPPPGMQWHRQDGWQEGDLPQGYRPLTQDDQPEMGDECIADGENSWQKSVNWKANLAKSLICRYRTTRPLTFTHAGKTWTWHRPGDPMPCDGEARVHVLFFDDLADDPPVSAKEVKWFRAGVCDIIGWRYADEEKTVPQDSTFFFPSTAIRFPEGSDHWSVVATLGSHGLIVEEKFYLFQELFDLKAMANRSIPLTGKWNPNSWEPCHKPISKNG